MNEVDTIKRRYIKYKMSELIKEAEKISTLLENGFDQECVEDEECRDFAKIREELKSFKDEF